MSPVPENLKRATRRLLEVRRRKPEAESGVEAAKWCDEMACALDDLSMVLLYGSDMERAKEEAERYRKKAKKMRGLSS
ncbi:hypothetical protein [Nocardiopsis sp. FR6]|uniref:hypothetical protein n=1 Tax=Nocardiopsis sp. FR6 TaxID=2605986 RepID=UPI001356DD63|nr:hypothetical protein [Nocardiopsis sp. FR6]